MQERDDKRRAGRPRDPKTDSAIMRATLEALGADGYARMSVDAIAAAAGVTKPTIYRRWPSKADLATAAIAELQSESPPRNSGETRQDLLAHLRHFRIGLSRPHGMATIGTLLSEEEHTPELIQLFRQRIVATRRSWIRAVLATGQERGDVRANLDLEIATNMVLGAYYAGYLERGSIPVDWDARILDTIWPALAPEEKS